MTETTDRCAPPSWTATNTLHWLQKSRKAFEVFRWHAVNGGCWASALGFATPEQMAERGYRYWSPARPPRLCLAEYEAARAAKEAAS